MKNQTNSFRKSKIRGTVGELFAGVGGFRLGLQDSGLETLFNNQFEPSTVSQHASSCYVKNFGSDGHFNIDIKLLADGLENESITLPHVDVLVGGFPCQDYSVAKSLNAAKGINGKKGVLWWEIRRIVSKLQPKFIFLENVDRLLKSPATQKGRDFAIMVTTLGDLGYQVEWRVINAAEEGFPQRRIRVFIVARRLDLSDLDSHFDDEKYLKKDSVLARSFPSTSLEELKTFDLSGSPEELTENFPAGVKSPFSTCGVFVNGRVTTAKFISKGSSERQTLGDVVLSPREVSPEFWIDEVELEKWRYQKGAKSLERTNSKTGHTFNYSEGKMAWPDLLEKPARTIVTGEGGKSPSRFKHVIEQDSRYRRLTPVELERLNGFPDNWTKFDSNNNQISDTKRAFFMGNALVVGLIRRVGREISKDLDNLRNQ